MFTAKYQMDSTDVWSCSNGNTQSRTSRVMQSIPLKTEFNRNANNKIEGWNLNGVDNTKGGTYLGGERLGAPYVGYCPSGGFTGFLPHEFDNKVISGVKLNGVDLKSSRLHEIITQIKQQWQADHAPVVTP